MKPNDVRVLQAFENLDLFKDTIICILVLANFLLLENDLIHLFKRIFDFSVLVIAEMNNSEGASTKLLLNNVLINHFLAILRFTFF